MKYAFTRILSVVAAAVTILSASAELRTWTTVEGRSFKGEYLEASDESVLILVKGKERKIKLEKLSDEDKEFIGQMRSQESKNRENSNFSGKWPTSTTMEDKLKAKAVKEDASGEGFIYETTHFRFLSPAKLSIQTVSEMGRIFEGTYTACRMMPLNFPCRRFNFNKEVDEQGEDDGKDKPEKLIARLFLTRADYENMVGPNHASSAGLFRSGIGDVLVPFSSLGISKKGGSYAIETGKKQDAGTLIHELTHQMTLFGAGYRTPIWFAEGMAEYMSLANFQRGRFDLRGVGKNIKPYIIGGPGVMGRNLGKSFSAPSLETFMNQSIPEFQAAVGEEIQFNYGFSTLLVYYFIHLDGKGDGARLKRWMRDLQESQSPTIMLPADATPEQRAEAQRKLTEMNAKTRSNYEKLLDNRTWAQLEKEFAKKVSKLGIDVRFER